MRQFINYIGKNFSTSISQMIKQSELFVKEQDRQIEFSSLMSWRKLIDESNQKQAQCDEKIIVLANGEGIFKQLSKKKKIQQSRVSCKMIGLSSSTKNMSEFVESPYIVDKYSCAFLVNHKILRPNLLISNQKGIEILKTLCKDPTYAAYSYLIIRRKCFLVDGHKFGCTFLAYNEPPTAVHAAYLIFVVTADQRQKLSMDHISRLAGICKKKALIIRVFVNDDSSFTVQQEQMIPKSGQRRKTQKEVQKTEQLLLLKRMLGYNC